MQKKLIALAIAGLSSAAFAQTNVTIYGVADGTFDYIKINNALGNPSNTRVTSNGSNLGFKGTENLGNGMKAIFQFETEVNFDNNSSLGLNRDSFVGLNGSFGQVTLGTQTGPTKALGDRLDVNSGDTIMSNTAVLGKLGGAFANSGLLPLFKGQQFASGSTFDTRFKNSIQYVTPSFSGLQATAMYVANENKISTPGSKVNSSAYDLGVNYANGPVFVGATYARISERNDGFVFLPLANVLGTNQVDKEFRIGGMYDFGMATVRALYARTKMDIDGFNAKQNVWGIGGTFNVSPNGKLVAQYYKAADLDAGGADDNTGAKFYTIGYEHSLSKRTMLKAGYAYLKNDSAVATNGFGGGYDFGYNSVGVAGDNVKLSGFQFGMRHAF